MRIGDGTDGYCSSVQSPGSFRASIMHVIILCVSKIIANMAKKEAQKNTKALDIFKKIWYTTMYECYV